MLYMEDALEGINSPMDYFYVKLLSTVMKTMFYWPAELFGENCWKISRYRGVYPIVLNVLILSSNIAYLVANGGNLTFLEIGHMYITMFLTMLSMSRSMILPLNPKFKNILVQYFTKLHLFHHANKSEYAKSMHIKMHKISHLAVLFLFLQMICGLTLFNVIPMYLNYSKGRLKHRYLVNDTFELSVYLLFPLDATTNRNSYYFLATFNWYASYMCSSVICMNDLMLFLMVFHVYGHFKILLSLMATFPRPADTKIEDGGLEIVMQKNQMFSQTELDDVCNKLKECIDYHKFLKSFTNTMSDAFGPMLLIYFAFHQVSCCLLLLECSEMSFKALIRYGPLTIIVFQALIQISVIFEMIGTVSEKLQEGIYELPWESMDTKNRQIVLFFLMNVQNPIHVKAMGITDVGVMTMSSILKTSISYFTFLRTVPE